MLSIYCEIDNRSFQSHQNPVIYGSWHFCWLYLSELPESWRLCFLSTIGVDNCSFQRYQNPVNSGSWHFSWPQLLELPKSCQQWELTFPWTVAFRSNRTLSTVTFLLTIFFRATKLLSAVGVDIPVDHSFQGYLKHGRLSASHQLLELTTVTFRATKILSVVRVDIAVDRNFQNHQILVNSGSWQSCWMQPLELPKPCQ